MKHVKKIVLIIVIVVAAVIISQYSEPLIPSDATHVGAVTCFSCHETGVEGAPKFPSWHENKVDNINECLKCHKIEGS